MRYSPPGPISAATLASLGGAALTRALISRTATADVSAPADAILVFGAAVSRGRPCPALRCRLEHAAELARAGMAPEVVCLGGAAEVRVMREFLLGAGIAARAVTLEPGGTTTRRSVSAAARRPGWKRVIAVSSGYHMRRILAECRRQGVCAQGSAAVPPAPSRTLAGRAWLELHAAREVLALWWYALTARLGTDRGRPAGSALADILRRAETSTDGSTPGAVARPLAPPARR